jgi:hypothetical protein
LINIQIATYDPHTPHIVDAFMSQLHFYVPDEVEKRVRLKAKQAKLPVSKYLAELVKRETSSQNQWPLGYVELFDAWQGKAQKRPAELPLETRVGFN